MLLMFVEGTGCFAVTRRSHKAFTQGVTQKSRFLEKLIKEVGARPEAGRYI